MHTATHGQGPSPGNSLKIFQPRVTKCRSLTQILTLSFEVLSARPLNLNSKAVSFLFSVTLTSHAESLVYCDLDLFCLEFSFSVTLTSIAESFVFCDLDL